MPRTERGLPAEPPPRRYAAAELVGTQGQTRLTHPAGDADVEAKPRTTRRISLDLEAQVVEDLKDAVVYLQHNGHPEATQVGIAVAGIKSALARLRREHKLVRFPSRGQVAPKPGRRPT